MFRRLNSLRNRSITVRAAVLTVTVLAVYLPAAAVGLLAGPAGVVDCSAAAFACFLGAAIALFISHFMRGPIPALSGAMLGMLARMAFPLAMAVAYVLVSSSRPDPAPLYWLLIFYPVTLTAEIMLSIPLDGACRPVQQQPDRRVGETWT